MRRHLCPASWQYPAGRYTWQLEQLVEEQELQEEAPPIGVDSPSPLLEKEEKEESIRLAL